MIYYFDTFDSTNTYMYDNISQFDDGDAVLTFRQTSGKGRGEHIWNGGKKSFAYSVLKILSRPTPEASLMAGLAVAKTLDNISLKWPNDILCNGKKLGGILCKSVIFPECTRVIIGIGININESTEFFSSYGLKEATSLAIENKKSYNEDFYYKLSEKITEHINDVFGSSEDWLKEYKEHCSTIGKTVNMRIENDVVSGIVKDILPDGRMTLLCANGDEKNVYANNWE